jgi:hypothetical protein
MALVGAAHKAYAYQLLHLSNSTYLPLISRYISPFGAKQNHQLVFYFKLLLSIFQLQVDFCRVVLPRYNELNRNPSTNQNRHLARRVVLYVPPTGEPSAASEALRRAEEPLRGSERKGLKAAACRIRASLVEPTVKGIIT